MSRNRKLLRPQTGTSSQFVGVLYCLGAQVPNARNESVSGEFIYFFASLDVFFPTINLNMQIFCISSLLGLYVTLSE